MRLVGIAAALVVAASCRTGARAHAWDPIAGVRVLDLTGDLVPEVWVSESSGGAHCCTTERFFAWRGGRLVETLTVDALDGGVREIRGRDGVPEIVLDLPIYVPELGYASIWRPLVLTWRGGEFVDETGRHGDLAEAYMAEEWAALTDPRVNAGREVNALRYYANAILAGTEQPAYARLLGILAEDEPALAAFTRLAAGIRPRVAERRYLNRYRRDELR